jgi:hypothetical protein
MIVLSFRSTNCSEHRRLSRHCQHSPNIRHRGRHQLQEALRIVIDRRRIRYRSMFHDHLAQ